MRTCTDCGRPTPNYRCERCWKKRRGFGFADADESRSEVSLPEDRYIPNTGLGKAPLEPKRIFNGLPKRRQTTEKPMYTTTTPAVKPKPAPTPPAPPKAGYTLLDIASKAKMDYAGVCKGISALRRGEDPATSKYRSHMRRVSAALQALGITPLDVVRLRKLSQPNNAPALPAQSAAPESSPTPVHMPPAAFGHEELEDALDFVEPEEALGAPVIFGWDFAKPEEGPEAPAAPEQLPESYLGPDRRKNGKPVGGGAPTESSFPLEHLLQAVRERLPQGATLTITL